MRHIKTVSARRPVRQVRPRPAQFEPVLQLIGLLSAAVALVEQVGRVFGIEIPQKNQDGG